MQRLVLTGTPIQNNLDELFAVVNFTVPGYLGSLEEFQRKFARVIEAGNDPEALPKILEKVTTCCYKNIVAINKQYLIMFGFS
jgi:SNF2 family DNA or RNA helicase